MATDYEVTHLAKHNPDMKKPQKHKFKRRRGLSYIVLAYCEKCGLEREGIKGEYTYITKVYNPNSGRYTTTHLEIPPPCGRVVLEKIMKSPCSLSSRAVTGLKKAF